MVATITVATGCTPNVRRVSGLAFHEASLAASTSMRTEATVIAAAGIAQATASVGSTGCTISLHTASPTQSRLDAMSASRVARAGVKRPPRCLLYTSDA